MELFIITRGRVLTQVTLRHIPDSWLGRTYLVCPRAEVKTLNHLYDVGVIGVPDWVLDYSKKVQWTMEHIHNMRGGKGVILDDDLWWDQRNPDNWKQMYKMSREEENVQLPFMWEQMEAHLDEVPLCSVHPRMMGNLAPRPYKENGKVCVIQGINTKLFPNKTPMKVDYDPILADVHLNMYLLSRGYGNRLITDWVVNWGPSQAPGGCEYRTLTMQRIACERIAEMYNPYAKVEIKRPKTAQWLGKERHDLRVQWKQLFKHAPKASAGGHKA